MKEISHVRSQKIAHLIAPSGTREMASLSLPPVFERNKSNFVDFLSQKSWEMCQRADKTSPFLSFYVNLN